MGREEGPTVRNLVLFWVCSCKITQIYIFLPVFCNAG